MKNYVKSSNGVAWQICDTFRTKCVVNKLKFICAPFLNEAEIQYLDKILYKKHLPKVYENIGNSGMLGLPIVVSQLHRDHYLTIQRLNIIIEPNCTARYYYRIISN